MEIIAHRGYSSSYPENTMVAMEKAYEIVNFVELDIQLTLDNKVVVIHDYTLRRVGDSGAVVALSTYEKLRRLDIGSWFNEKFKDERVEELNKILNLVKKDDMINIEIKKFLLKRDRLIEKTLDIVKESNKVKNVVISSFSKKILKKVREKEPNIKVGLLIDKKDNLESIVKKVKDLNPYSIHIPLNLADKKNVAKLRNLGKIIYVYTVNEIEDMKRIYSLGVDGIFTDYPSRGIKILEEVEGDELVDEKDGRYTR